MRIVLIWLLLLPAMVMAAPITSNGTGGGEWATGATWAGGVAPSSSDTAIIAATDTVTINSDLSGTILAKDASNNSVTVTGILNCATTASGYLKVSGNIIGVGTINCGTSGTALPSTRTMKFDFNGTAYGLNSSTLALNFYCWNPTIARQYVVTSGSEAAGQTVLEVGTNMTADWGAFDTAYFGATGAHAQVHVNDISGALPDSELRTIASINAGDITVSAGLTAEKAAGSQIVLLTRNIRIIGTNGTGSAILACKAGSVLGCEMEAGASTAYGLGASAGNGCILNGSIWGYSRGINTGTGHINNGTISGNTSGIYTGIGNVNNGTISGNTNGINSGIGHVNNGTISGNTNGISSGSGHINNGTISGNTYGIIRSMVYNYNAILNNTINIQQSIVECFNTSMSGTTTQENTDYLLLPGSYSFSKDHDKTPGAFQAWSGGGKVTSTDEVNNRPPGLGFSFKHEHESTVYPTIRQEEYFVSSGKTLTLQCWFRAAQSLVTAPKIELLTLGGTVLTSAVMPVIDGSNMDWQDVTVSWENTAAYEQTVLCRVSTIQTAPGVVYEVFVDKSSTSKQTIFGGGSIYGN